MAKTVPILIYFLILKFSFCHSVHQGCNCDKYYAVCLSPFLSRVILVLPNTVPNLECFIFYEKYCDKDGTLLFSVPKSMIIWHGFDSMPKSYFSCNDWMVIVELHLIAFRICFHMLIDDVIYYSKCSYSSTWIKIWHLDKINRLY